MGGLSTQAGQYTCLPSLLQTASVDLYVLNQDGNPFPIGPDLNQSDRGCLTRAEDILLLTALFISQWMELWRNSVGNLRSTWGLAERLFVHSVNWDASYGRTLPEKKDGDGTYVDASSCHHFSHQIYFIAH